MSQEQEKPKQNIPPQSQDDQPGHREQMNPRPIDDDPNYRGSGKLENLVALITGGDSGIGRAVSIAYAKEGADIAIVYYDEHEDAQSAKQAVEKYGRRCILIPGDVSQEAFCRQAVDQTVQELGRLDILVNNAAVQFPQKSILDITEQQLDRTFRTNIYAMFFLVKAALPHLAKGSAIINNASITAYQGSPQLLDYSSTKGAIIAFTRSLSINLADQEIRVNAVAPGPIWTPLIPATFDEEKVSKFGEDTPMKRAGQPFELAPAFVFLASAEMSSYISGQTVHVNGGRVVNG